MEIRSVSPGIYQKTIQINRMNESAPTPDTKPNQYGETREGNNTGQKGDRNQTSGPFDHLDLKEQRRIDQLEKIDASVRSHELAHISAGGRFVKGGARFQYQTGPDGRQYAVAGEVSIDSSPVPGDPEATVEKMDTIRAAALAPSDPSGQDQRVAAMASRVRAEALMEISLMRVKEGTASDENHPGAPYQAAAAYQENGKETETGSLVNIVK